MNGILDERTEKYLNELLPARDPVLRAMETYAARHHVPIIGPACGRMLHQLARVIAARRVFELGSAIGYSTLWLARAVGPKGRVFYTDTDPANAKRAETSFRRAGVQTRVIILVGEALKMLDSTQGQFDLIFNDVNKTQYPQVFRRALPRLRAGGLFVTDNILWWGRTARPDLNRDPETVAIRKFNRLIYQSSNVFTTVIPLRDGFAVCLKAAPP